MEQITWMPVKGFEDRYEVSNDGRVRSLDVVVKCRGTGTRTHRGKILPQRPNNRGYMCVYLCRDQVQYTKLVHRLVAEAFVEMPDGKNQVNHKDKNIKNNTCSNLEWVSDDENKKHSSIANGGTQRPQRAVAVTTVATGDVQEFCGLREAERTLGLDHSTALRVIAGKVRQTKGYSLCYV